MISLRTSCTLVTDPRSDLCLCHLHYTRHAGSFVTYCWDLIFTSSCTSASSSCTSVSTTCWHHGSVPTCLTTSSTSTTSQSTSLLMPSLSLWICTGRNTCTLYTTENIGIRQLTSKVNTSSWTTSSLSLATTTCDTTVARAG